jgi:hypothetical protein
MGLWASLAMLNGLGPLDPGSNPGSPIIKTFLKRVKNKNIGKNGKKEIRKF